MTVKWSLNAMCVLSVVGLVGIHVYKRALLLQSIIDLRCIAYVTCNLL